MHSIEAQTIKKLRLRLLPFLFLLYVICYLDRINVSIAALTMNKDLGMTSEQYGLLTGIFFIGYFLFEVPSNLLRHKIGARIWIARILISWGLMATLTGFVQEVHQMYVVRFMLGLAEAGYVPGAYLYLTKTGRLTLNLVYACASPWLAHMRKQGAELSPHPRVDL